MGKQTFGLMLLTEFLPTNTMKKLLLCSMLFFATANSNQCDFGYADFDNSDEEFGIYYESPWFDPRDVATVQVKDLTHQALPTTAEEQQLNFLKYCMLVVAAAFAFDSFSITNDHGKVLYHCKPLSTAFRWCSNAAWLSGL
jgi:hypothetical protein